MAARLASSEIMTDWGARPLAASNPLFDPLHYNNGAVWPFVTGWVSLAEYRYHDAAAGKFALDAIARTTFDESRGRNPEVISGRLYKPLDTAVPQQFFATSMILTPLIRGLLGIDVDAPARRLTLAPHLPPDWDSVHVRNIPVGTGFVDATVRRTASGIGAELRRRGGRAPIEVAFSPALPLGALTSAATTTTPGDVHATVHGTLRDALALNIAYRGGWSIVPPGNDVHIGDRSSAARVLSERLVGGAYTVVLEGRAGRAYPFRVFEGSAGRDTVVTFPNTGANADGYTSVVLTLSAGKRRLP